MTDVAELVARLRAQSEVPIDNNIDYIQGADAIMREAADALSALERELEEARAACVVAWNSISRFPGSVHDHAMSKLERIIKGANLDYRDPGAAALTTSQAEVERLKALVTDMTKAARTLELAEEELHRAEAMAEQPRLSNAGTRYYAAKQKVFSVAFRARAALQVEESKG